MISCRTRERTLTNYSQVRDRHSTADTDLGLIADHFINNSTKLESQQTNKSNSTFQPRDHDKESDYDEDEDDTYNDLVYEIENLVRDDQDWTIGISNRF